MSIRKLLRRRSERNNNNINNITNNEKEEPPIKHNNTFREEEASNSSESATAQEKDTLAIMYSIIMQIRNDPEYARSIYANCPRLQHLLEKRPDLQPIFEDPKFVRINFEDVFRKEGGVLPEDQDNPKPKKKPPSRLTRCVVCVVKHPLFKVLRVLLLIKKLVGCIFGGGFALVSGFVAGVFFCESAADMADEIDVDNNADADHDADADAEAREQAIQEKHAANKEALNKAADHLEDPEVQAKMDELMQMEPDQFAQAIENDDELRALRDSSPVCAELMSDPETMKIVCDPDNLRALGEAPELIEMDFADPDWTPPEGDLEMGADADPDVDADVDTGMEQEGDDELDFSISGDEDIEEGNTYEVEQADCDVEQADCDVADEYELGQTHAATSSNNHKDKDNKEQQNNEGFRTIFAQVGAGISDIVASELVGFSFREVTGGGDDGLGGITQAAGGVDTGAVEDAVDIGDMDNQVEHMEDAMEEVKDAHDSEVAGAVVAKNGSSKDAMSDDERERGNGDNFENEDEDAPVDAKKKRFGAAGVFASRLRTAAKEYVAGAIFSEDLGELIVEKMEEKKKDKRDELKLSENEKYENEDKMGEEIKEVKTKRGFFKRK